MNVYGTEGAARKRVSIWEVEWGSQGTGRPEGPVRSRARAEGLQNNVKGPGLTDYRIQSWGGGWEQEKSGCVGLVLNDL